MARITLPQPSKDRVGAPPKIDSGTIDTVQGALLALGHDIDRKDRARRELGESTAEAVRAFQKKAHLKATGTLDAATVTRLSADLEHHHATTNKTRVAKIQDALTRAGIPVDEGEARQRVFGRNTEAAFKKYQERIGVKADGRLSDELLARLHEEALKQRWTSKPQVKKMQRMLVRALDIAKLDAAVDADEIRGRTLGASTTNAVKALQKRYGLPETGNVDVATYERITSIAASRPQPVKLLTAQPADLTPLRRAARINMSGQHVAAVQKTLAVLGYRVAETEHRQERFGVSTREAVMAYQRARGIPLTGHADGVTLRRMSGDAQQLSAGATPSHTYRIRGTARDELWHGMSGQRVQVWEKLVIGNGAMLVERTTGYNGFYDAPYEPPVDTVTGRTKEAYSLEVRLIEPGDNGALIASKTVFNPTVIAWANFTKGDHPYRGISEFAERSAAVRRVIDPTAIAALVETPAQPQITDVAQATGLLPEDVMRLVLAERVAVDLNTAAIDAAACYAFIGQNLPATLPGELIEATEDWTLIGQLVEQTAAGLVFMEPELQAEGFEGAITANLMPIAVGRRKTAVLAALATLRQSFTLRKPILAGGATLQSLLGATSVAAANYGAVATALVEHRSFNSEFWNSLETNAGRYGGAAAVKDLRATVEVGHISANFMPMVTALKQALVDPLAPDINTTRDLAKLSTTQWETLINANGGQVPPTFTGTTKVRDYAQAMFARSEQLFPAMTLLATLGRSAGHPLTKVAEIQTLLDGNPEFDLRSGNLDAFVIEKGLTPSAQELTEARVVQRVHRLAPTAAAGEALLELKIHNSQQIVGMGRARFSKMLADTGHVDLRVARTVYGQAESQYARVLQRLTEYRYDLHRADPPVIVDHTYGQAELATLAPEADLKTLFGTLDYCACSHCQSVYGPAAYLADVLRYLATHDAEVAGKTVQTILFERRPDLGNIKLNCENTDTPLPYIDLVNEILENAVNVPPTNRNFANQTTLDWAQLRAAPEYVRDGAYDALKTAEYPMNVAFDLRQEETRVFLRHLGVERWELMDALQARPAAGAHVPTDVSIAGEFWGMSSTQTTLVTAATDATAARQTTFWRFDATQPERIVAEFLRQARIDYQQLLDLLYVTWLNPLTVVNPVTIDRPDATCDTEVQTLKNLTVPILDKMHRFLRLWRSTGWAMWELDLLLRSGVIANGALDAPALARLKEFKQLQRRLAGLTVEQTLMFFGNINTEVRKKPDDPQQVIAPLYQALFQNPGVTMPVDPDFALPFGAALTLSGHRGTLLAAFALTEADLTRILAKLANDNLTEANVAAIGRYALLARGLGMSVKDLLTLIGVSGIADIFASPKALLDFIDSSDWVRQSAFAIDEIDYLLTTNADTPYGLRDAVVTEYLDVLREALRSGTAQPAGIVKAHLADAFALSREQVERLVTTVQIGGRSVLANLTAAAFTARNASNDAFATATTPANFPDAYNCYRLLHKAALLLTRLELSDDDLAWLLANAATFSLLAPGSLPVSVAPGAALFPAWLALVQWCHLDRLFPQPGDVALRDIFTKAAVVATPVADLRTMIAQRMPWLAADVASFAAALQLQHAAGALDYAKVASWLRLERAFGQLKRIGAAADQLVAWSRRDVTAGNAQRAAAQQTRQTAKAKYDAATWLTTLTPLEDALREKKRDALVAWLVESSLRTAQRTIVFGGKTYPNPLWWQDADDLLRYFLIDVEMSACQPTSRIKQAMSSAQMFVQRCLLGRERPYVEVSRAQQLDTASANSWKQWEWMKSYRIWEANRKTFLYPESWIEPDLRDDKSPFFEELEAEIMQNEITDENVEAAFLHYVQKVHEVARLDIVGCYHELDDTDPYDNLPPDINRLHVIGRTRAQPSVYYYRAFDLNYGEWSAWEKIDLDIDSEQVTPVVYNRKLYLFWLTFLEKPQKVRKQPAAQPSAGPTESPEPPSQLEVQLAWSARKESGWTAKRISRQRLIHPWQRPLHAYNLKPRYKRRENLLWLDVYVTQTVQFNNGRFWDAYAGQMDFVTHTRFDETCRPWHSSSFVFDGQVVDVKMKGLIANYRIPGPTGIPSDALSNTNSYEWVRTSFGPAGHAINRLVGPYEIGPRLPLPSGMHYDRTRLANNKSSLNANGANVLEYGNSRTLLNGARSPFEIVHSQHAITFDAATAGKVPFIYQDAARSFFIRPEWPDDTGGPQPPVTYRFYPFYHPYTALFMRELNRSGVDGLLNRRIQTSPQTFYPGNGYAFSQYAPTSVSVADGTAATDRVDFERYGAYALYNWEIFFHAPMLIAGKLSTDQRFDAAMRWYHYIFDPTNADSPDVPQRYWITRPFYETNADAYRQQRIDVLLKNINQYTDQLTAWKNNPFKPHLIARYRPVAYQKAIVMKYLDNLIAWADRLYARDTIESINEATTLYVIAHEILGRKPVKVPNVQHADLTYNELVAAGPLDPFGNKRVDILMENFTGTPVTVSRSEGGTETLPTLDMFYFAIPTNDKLLQYWTTIEERLFNIRHCRNIAGVYRQLPLFEPPIDPALLVKAAAAGVDLGNVLDDLAAPASPYRFQRLAQQAVELCGEVRALGDKLLAALEKQDAEGLSLLRSTQELAMQKAMLSVRKQQIAEAQQNRAVLDQTRSSAEQRKAFYEGREFMNGWEITALTLGGVSAAAQTAIAVGYILSGGLALIPRFTAGVSGFGGSPEVTVDPIEGLSLSKAASDAVATLSAIATAADKIGALAATVGSYRRRQDDWTLQGALATTEIGQIDRQIAAADIRIALAERELENQELQIEHAQQSDEYLRTKYTNQQLYDWHVRQTAGLYFQCYKLAYDTAKRAEKCYRFEIGRPTDTFVQFGYWDSLKKGLLAGERLTLDLRRMQSAYLDANTRPLEIIKQISLAQVAPMSLQNLKLNGSCTVTLPEWLFDMDYPGHIQRRIKSVALSIPCVTGPFGSVNCTLTLTRNIVRLNANTAGASAGDYGNALAAVGGDARFASSPTPVTAIVTSHGQSDTGMFELNLNDERYLAFENSGAVSEWSLSMPAANLSFDPATIADVVLHLRYTARAGGSANLETAARANLAATLPSEGRRLLVLNQDNATEWYRFLASSPGTDQALTLKLGREHLPFWARSRTNVYLTSVDLMAESGGGFAGNFDVRLTVPGLAEQNVTLQPLAALGNHHSGNKAGYGATQALLGDWTIKIKKVAAGDWRSLKAEDIKNAYLLLTFRAP